MSTGVVHIPKSVWPVLTAAVASLQVVPAGAWAQTSNAPPGSAFVVKDFVLAEHYEGAGAPAGETNLLKALVTGKEAVPHGRDFYLVRTMRMEHYDRDGRTNLVARAPACIVDPVRREVHSPERVQAEGSGGNLLIEGEGFFCRLASFHFVISNNVRTVIRRESHRPTAP